MSSEIKCKPPKKWCGPKDKDLKYKPPYSERLKSFAWLSSDGVSELMSSDGVSFIGSISYI